MQKSLFEFLQLVIDWSGRLLVNQTHVVSFKLYSETLLRRISDLEVKVASPALRGHLHTLSDGGHGFPADFIILGSIITCVCRSPCHKGADIRWVATCFVSESSNHTYLTCLAEPCLPHWTLLYSILPAVLRASSCLDPRQSLCPSLDFFLRSL